MTMSFVANSNDDMFIKQQKKHLELEEQDMPNDYVIRCKLE